MSRENEHGELSCALLWPKLFSVARVEGLSARSARVVADLVCSAAGFSVYAAEHHFAKAVSLYTLAISKDGSNAVYFGNRSFAHIKVRRV